MRLAHVHVCAVAVVLSACSTTPSGEKGPDGTVACYLRVESSEPGVSIETNHVYAGKTPLRLRLFGDKNGSFHNFGSPTFVLNALPLNTNHFLQTQPFRTGIKSSPGDHIPGLVFFDMSRTNGVTTVDLLPEN